MQQYFIKGQVENPVTVSYTHLEICNCLHISTRTIQDWAAIYKKIWDFRIHKEKDVYKRQGLYLSDTGGILS